MPVARWISFAIAGVLAGLSAHPARADDYYALDANQRGVVFLDKTSLTVNGDLRTVVEILLYREPQPLSATKSYVLSEARKEYDCGHGRDRRLRSAAHDGTGRVVLDDPDPGPWESPDPNTVGGLMLAVACGRRDWPVQSVQADISGGSAVYERMLNSGREDAFQFYTDHPQYLGQPIASATVNELKTDFPDVLQAAEAATIARTKDGAADDVSGEAGQAVIRGFIFSHFTELAAAPDDVLRAWMGAQAALLTDLRQHDPQVCARVATVGTDPSGGHLAPEASARAEVAILKAIRAGMDHPVVHAPPTRTDVQILSAAMRALGASDGGIDAASRTGLGGLSPPDQCNTAIQYFGAIAAVPSDVGGRVASTIARLNSAVRQTAP